MTVAAIIKERLESAFSPAHLEVVDNSHKHVGHAGARPEGESHFHVTIVSTSFEGMSRLERQRAIYAQLNDLLEARIHALALTASTPTETARKR